LEEEQNELHFKNSIDSPVLYGQKIGLKHIYSQTYLMVNPNNLAKENGCIEVSDLDLK